LGGGLKDNFRTSKKGGVATAEGKERWEPQREREEYPCTIERKTG